LTRQQKSFGPELWAQGSRGVESALGGGAYIENMQTYRSGLLGPRPKWKKLWTLANTSSGFPSRTWAWSGKGLEDSDGATPVPSDVIALTGTLGLTAVNSAGTAVWSHGSDAYTAPRGFARLGPYELSLGHKYYVLSTTDTSASRPHTPTRTASTVASEYGYSDWIFGGAVVWANRAWYWGRDYTELASAGRMHYSDDHAWMTFSGTGTQYFDIDGDIEGATVIGKDLYVWTVDGKYWRFSTNGGPIEGLTITQAFEGRVPSGHGYQVLVDDVAFFLSHPGPQSTVVAQTSKGQDDEALRKLYSGNGDEYGAVTAQLTTGSSISNHIYIPYRGADDNSPLQGFVYYNGVWWNDTSLDFTTDDPPASPVLPGTTSTIVGLGSDLDNYGNMWMVHYHDESQTSPDPHIYTLYAYTRDVCLERPSHVNDTWSTDTEEMYIDSVLTDLDVSGTVKMPRLAGANVNEYVRINAITIDAAYWKDATDTYPTVRIVVKVRDQEGNLSTVTTDLSAGGLADAAGGPLRINGYTPGLPFTPWCEIELTDIDSLALEFVHVDFEVEDRKW
jgi:hypothetical protein